MMGWTGRLERRSVARAPSTDDRDRAGIPLSGRRSSSCPPRTGSAVHPTDPTGGRARVPPWVPNRSGGPFPGPRNRIGDAVSLLFVQPRFHASALQDLGHGALQQVFREGVLQCAAQGPILHVSANHVLRSVVARERSCSGGNPCGKTGRVSVKRIHGCSMDLQFPGAEDTLFKGFPGFIRTIDAHQNPFEHGCLQMRMSCSLRGDSNSLYLPPWSDSAFTIPFLSSLQAWSGQEVCACCLNFQLRVLRSCSWFPGPMVVSGR